jgi:chorismate--pyruvate lyase
MPLGIFQLFPNTNQKRRKQACNPYNLVLQCSTLQLSLITIRSAIVPIKFLHQQRPYPTRWQHYRRPIATRVPRQWQAWLYDKGSLTQRLVKASAGNFRVQVTRNSWGIPSPSERMATGLKPRQTAIIREVQLLCHDRPWVCARSIIPAHTLKGRQRRFKDIGTKPLGALLFAHPNMQRGAIKVAHLPQRDSAQKHWARRSVFVLDKQPILVTEVFLPPMQYLAPTIRT